MGNGFDQEDPLGILEKKPKQVDPLGILKKKEANGLGALGSKTGGGLGASGLGSTASKTGRIGSALDVQEFQEDPIGYKEKEVDEAAKDLWNSKGVNETTGARILGEKYSEVKKLNDEKQKLPKELFPDVNAAREHLQVRGEKLDEKNKTDVLAYNLVKSHDTNKQEIKNANQEYGTVDEMAAKLFDGRSLQEIPESKRGQIIHSLIESPEAKELATENQDFANKYYQTKANYLIQNPSFARQEIFTKIGQELEDKHMTGWLYANPSLKKVDKAVEQLMADGKMTPQEKLIYDDYRKIIAVGGGETLIKLTDLIHRGGYGLQHGLEAIDASGRTIINKVVGGGWLDPKGESLFQKAGLLETQSDRGKRLEQEESGMPTVEPKRFATKIGDAVEFTAQFAPLIAGQAIGIPSGANIVMNFLGNNMDRAESLFKGDIGRQNTYAALGTLIDRFALKLFPTGKVAEGFKRWMQPTLVDATNKLASKEITSDVFKKSVADRAISFLGNVGKGNFQAANALTVFDGLHSGLDIVAGKKDFNLERELAEKWDNYKTNWLNSSFLSGVGAIGKQSPKTGEVIYSEIARSPDHFSELVKNNKELSPELKKENLENIDHIKAISAEMENRELPAEKIGKFIRASLQQKALKDKAEKQPDKTLAEKDEKQVTELEIEKKSILDPNIGNQKIIEEFYNEELIPNADRILLEVEGKFSPAKVGEYLKYIAQQANGLTEDWKVSDAGIPKMEKHPKQLIEIANERWAKEIEKANEEEIKSHVPEPEEKSRIAVIMPGENIPHKTVEIKRPENEQPIVEENIVSPESVPPKEEVITETTTDKIGEPSKGEEKIPPAEPPTEPIEGEGGDKGGITHAANEIRRQDRLLPEYEKSPQTFEQWNNEAEKAIKDGYDVEKLMDKIEKGHDPDPVENAIRKIYIATLDAEIAKDPTDALLAKQKRFIEIGDLANSRAGRNLVSLKGENSPLSSISDFYVAKMEAAGVDKLTDKQKAETKEAFEKVQKADQNATAAMEAYREEIAKLKAENELLKQKKTAKPKSTQKRTHEDYVKERESYREELIKAKEKHEQWLKDQGIQKQGFGFTLTADMVKAIGKIIKSHVDETAQTLEQVIKKVFEDIKDIFPAVTEKDIRDVIAGEYAEKRPTRNELAAKMRDLKDEAYYINKLERLLAGTEPINEKQKVQRNQQITELQKKIAEFRKAEREAEKEPKEEVPDELKKLKALKNRNETEEKQIRERIRTGDFEVKKKVPFLEDPELQRKFPVQYKQTLDAIIKREEARHEFDIALLRDEMARWTPAQKASSILGKTAGTAKAIVTGIDDSAVAIQTYVSLLRRPRTGATALRLHLVHAASQKKFERWLAALHSSSDWKLMKESGLDVTEPSSLKEREKEEIFNNRFSGTIKVNGKEYKLIDAPLKPFERAFTTLGNVTRVVGFRTIAKKYFKEGYTFEKHPELFKSLATRLNTETGRGKQNEYIEDASKVVTLGIWSPRLMAAKLNMLGVSDVASLFIPGTKGYYRQLHPKERLAAIRDVAQFATTVMAMSYGIALAFGGDIDLDPLSSTFLDVKFKNGKSINFTAGFSGYIRAIAQFATGRKHKGGVSTKVGRLETAGRFFRGKTPPLTSTALNLAAGKNFMGQPTTPWGEVKNALTPISVRQISDQIQRDGATSFFTQGIPTFFGFNIKDERDYQGSSKTIIIKDPDKGTKREATADEYKKYLDLKTKTYEKEMKRLQHQDIHLDRYGDVIVERVTIKNSEGHVVERTNEFVEDDEGKIVRYWKLTPAQKKQLDQKIKKQMATRAKADLFGEGQDDDDE